MCRHTVRTVVCRHTVRTEFGQISLYMTYDAILLRTAGDEKFSQIEGNGTTLSHILRTNA